MSSSHRVLLTAAARADILDARTHIAADNPGAAERWARSIRDATLSLRTMPLRGSIIPEAALLGVEYRQLVHGNYRIVYRVEKERVLVMRVIHGARLLRLPGHE